MLQQSQRHQKYEITLFGQRADENGSFVRLRILELSIFGCFIEWFPNVQLGESFRLKIPLANGNALPIQCKVIYRFPNNGIGVKFLDLTQFEQDLIVELIFINLSQKNLLLNDQARSSLPDALGSDRESEFVESSIDAAGIDYA